MGGGEGEIEEDFMRLRIPLCRHCRLGEGECEYRNGLRLVLRPLRPDITITHACPEYRKTWEVGDRVQVELHEIEGGFGIDPYDGSPTGGPEWVSCGWVSGTITDERQTSLPIFLVKLDTPVTLNLPERGGDWQSAKDRPVEIVSKRSNKIRPEKD